MHIAGVVKSDIVAESSPGQGAGIRIAVAPWAVAAGGAGHEQGILRHQLQALFIAVGNVKPILFRQQKREDKPVNTAIVIRSTAFDLAAAGGHLGVDAAFHFMQGMTSPELGVFKLREHAG